MACVFKSDYFWCTSLFMLNTYREAIEKEIVNLRYASELAPCPTFLCKREIGAIKTYAFKDTHRFYAMKKANKVDDTISRRRLQLLGLRVNMVDMFVTEEGKKDRVLTICDRVTAKQNSRK
jgi:hypothetical protein